MKINDFQTESWSQKYKSSINCSHPKGFSQRAHCAGKKKQNESVEMEMVCEDCGMCKSHGSLNEIRKGAKDSNGYTRCWPGKHAEGTKKGKNGGQVRNCVPNESIQESKQRCKQCGMTDCSCRPGTCKCKPIKGWVPGKGFKKAIDEAANAAQQAAIAIAKKKKAGVKEAFNPVNEGMPVDNDMGATPSGAKMTLGQWKQMWMKKMPNADFAAMFRSPPNMQGSAIAYFDGWMNNPDARWDPQQGVAEGASSIEQKIIKLYKQGLSDDEIASRLKIDSDDVKSVLDDYEWVADTTGEEKGVAEGFNGEYDDEAGMAQGNLYTIAQAAQGLLDTIDDRDNLPEWAQEKIAKVEGMLVSVWNYLQSQKAQGIDPEINEMYEAMDQLAEEMAAKKGISADLVWESFEALDDHMLYETAAWRRKEGKSKKGGLNAKGVASYRRENPGSKLQTAVTTKPSKLKPGSKAAKRRKSFCARMSGVKGPAKKPNGKPTRKTLALRKWNC